MAGVGSQGNFSENYGETILRKLDLDFEQSPRLLVRGIWGGDILELHARRRTEGQQVEWEIQNRRDNTTVLRVNAIMSYKYRLGLSSKSYGRPVLGGWGWRGYGYGFINLFPGNRLP